MNETELQQGMRDMDPCSIIEESFRVRDAEGNIKDLKLLPFQQEFFKSGPLYGFRQDRIINKSRKIGFTMLDIIEDLLLAGSMAGTYYPVIASDEDQAKRTIRMGKQLLRDAKIKPFSITNDSTESIICDNGSMIETFPGTRQSGIRGPLAFKLTLDEFAHNPIQSDILAAASPMLAQNGIMTIISTPWGVNNEYWRLWSKAEEMKLVPLYQPIFTNIEKFNVHLPIPEQIEKGLKLVAPWINIEKLERDRIRDPVKFLQEYCCSPAEESYTLFGRKNVEDAIQPDQAFIYRANPDTVSPFNNEFAHEQFPYFIGCDFAISEAMSADSSVYAVGRLMQDNDIELVNLYSNRGMSTVDQEKALVHLYAQYRPVTLTVEENSFGKGIFDHLRKKVPVVVPFNTTSRSKPTLVRLLQEWLGNNKLKVRGGKTLKEKAEVAQWRIEMMAFSKIENKAKTNYKMEGAGQHDDYVMATGFMINAIAEYLALSPEYAAESVRGDWGPANTQRDRHDSDIEIGEGGSYRFKRTRKSDIVV